MFTTQHNRVLRICRSPRTISSAGNTGSFALTSAHIAYRCINASVFFHESFQFCSFPLSFLKLPLRSFLRFLSFLSSVIVQSIRGYCWREKSLGIGRKGKLGNRGCLGEFSAFLNFLLLFISFLIGIPLGSDDVFDFLLLTSWFYEIFILRILFSLILSIISNIIFNHFLSLFIIVRILIQKS